MVRALSNWRSNSWFANFMVRLLEGSHDVLQLIEKNPFASTPPKYVRALLYNYRFTDFRRAPRHWRMVVPRAEGPVLSSNFTARRSPLNALFLSRPEFLAQDQFADLPCSGLGQRLVC